MSYQILTVSSIPEALGFPSILTGSPPRYRDSRLSSGFNVGFSFLAAAIDKVRKCIERRVGLNTLRKRHG